MKGNTVLVISTMLSLLVWGCEFSQENQLSSDKEITFFSFPDIGISGDIIDTNITFSVPHGTDVTALVATFATTAAFVKVGPIGQVSGKTKNDFTNTKTYTTVADDGSTQDYIVEVKIAVKSDEKIVSDGSISEPTLLAINVSNNLKIGSYDNPSYYKIGIPKNNYYDFTISNVKSSDVVFNFEVLCDSTFTKNFDNGTSVFRFSSIREIRLFGGKTYYIKAINISNGNGSNFDMFINEHAAYPPITALPLEILVGGQIGQYGINESDRYYSFTTNDAGFYTVIRSYPPGRQISEMTHFFMPGDGSSLSGSFSNTNSVYSLLKSTTYYITLRSSYSEPIIYSIIVEKGNHLFK